MTKEELLKELASKLGTGELSRAELSKAMGEVQGQEPSAESVKKVHFGITKILYVLGVVIAIIGVSVFVAQVWDDIGSFGHILVTFGLGLVFALVGSALLMQDKHKTIGSIFHLLGGLLIPAGVLVSLNEMSVELNSMLTLAIVFGAVALFYAVLTMVHKNALLTFFAIGYSTVCIYFLFVEITKDLLDPSALYAYFTMLIGLSYIMFGQSFSKTWNKALTGALYLFGSAGFLGAGFSRAVDSTFWLLTFFLIIAGGFAISVRLRSRSILATSTIFLLVHVSYITGEYFADSLGWPIVLVLLGFLFIGLGYASIKFDKEYIQL